MMVNSRNSRGPLVACGCVGMIRSVCKSEPLLIINMDDHCADGSRRRLLPSEGGVHFTLTSLFVVSGSQATRNGLTQQQIIGLIKIKFFGDKNQQVLGVQPAQLH